MSICAGFYFLPLLKRKIISATTATTTSTPTQTPALNIPPITSQLDNVATNNNSSRDREFFIVNIFR